MKKLFLLLLMTSGFLFTSCNNDDGDEPIVIDESLIPGLWNVTAMELSDGQSVTTFDETSISANYSSYGKDFDLQINFIDSTDPKTYTSEGGYTAVITISALGQSQTQEETVSDFFGAGTWSVENNKILMSNIVDGETVIQEGEIIMLTEDTLKMKIVFDETIEDADLGISVRTSGVVESTLTRAQ